MPSDGAKARAGHVPYLTILSAPPLLAPGFGYPIARTAAQVQRRAPWPGSNAPPIRQPPVDWQDQPSHTAASCDPPRSGPFPTPTPVICVSRPPGFQAGQARPGRLGHVDEVLARVDTQAAIVDQDGVEHRGGLAGFVPPDKQPVFRTNFCWADRVLHEVMPRPDLCRVRNLKARISVVCHSLPYSHAA